MFSLDTDESKKAFKQLIKIAENNSNDSSTFIGALSNNLLALVQGADYEAYLRQFDENILTTRNYDGIALRIALREDDDTIKMEYANLLFYVYFREWQFRKNINFNGDIVISQFLRKIKELKERFSDKTQYLFDFYEQLPFKVFQDEFHSNHAIKLSQAIKATDIEKIDKFMGSYECVVDKIEIWEKELPNTIEKVKSLRDNLEEQKTAFNFVGLYSGFSGLEIQKKESLFWKRWEYYGLLFLMLLVPSVELYWAITHLESLKLDAPKIAMIALPTITIVVFLFYFLRVALGDMKSIQSQILQIELRMTLCQFIQNYAEQSKALKEQNKEGFEKFESLIFSSIVSSDEKIPATFDGVEQLAGLLKIFQNKSD